MTTENDIKSWLLRARDLGVTHLVLVCDEWDNGLFPVYVPSDWKLSDVVRDYTRPMHHIAVVYDAPFSPYIDACGQADCHALQKATA